MQDADEYCFEADLLAYGKIPASGDGAHHPGDCGVAMGENSAAGMKPGDEAPLYFSALKRSG